MTKTMKKMPEVLLAGVIAVAFAFAIGAAGAQEAYAAELYEGTLYVGGQDIVKADDQTVAGGQGTAKLSYDDNGNPVLTLNNYKCENCTGGGSKTYNAVINYRGTTPFTIQMIGVNAVKSASGNYVYNGIFSAGPLVITGDGSLSASGVMQRDYRNSGIVCSKDIWIQSGIVTAIGGDTQESSGSSYGIRADTIIKITGGTVNASGGNAGGDSYGIAGGNGVEITGGNVKAIAGSAGNNYSYGIWGGATTTIDIGSGVTRVESAGANRALVGIIKNAIPGTGWDSTDGTGDGTLIPDNQSGASLYYKKVVFEPTLDVRIKGNTSNVKYNGKEQFATGFTAEYKVSDGGWTAKAPDGVSVKLKDRFTAEAKGTDVKTYKMGLTADSFDINPGNYKPGEVTVTDGSLTIGRAPLTIKAKDQTLVYNGQTQGERGTTYQDPAEIARKVTVKGLQGSDKLTKIDIFSQGKEIGESPIVPSAAGIEKTDGNYDITYVEGTLTITPIPLKVTLSGSSAKKVYNGKQQTYTGTVTVKSSDPAFDASKFSYKGSKDVTGTDAGVYTTHLATESCVYNDPHYELNVSIGEPVKLTINKADITITANDQKLTYNGQTQGEGDTTYEDAAQIARKVTVEGLQGSDALTKIDVDGQGDVAGEYDLVPNAAAIGEGGKLNGNYEITYVNGTLTITRAYITPSVSIKGWTYGSPANEPSVEGNPGGGEVTFQYKKTGEPDSAYAETVPTDAGTYTVKAEVAETKNYNAGEATLDFTISPADMQVTSAGYNGAYDGGAHNITVNAPEGAEVMYAGPGGSFTEENPAFTDAGTYAVDFRVRLENYNDYSGSQEVVITPAALTVTAKDQHLTYNGKDQGPGDTAYEDAAQIAELVSTVGLQGTDALSSIIVDGQGAIVGEYPLIPGSAAINGGNGNGNYDISYVNGTLRIDPCPITIKADDKSSKYGEALKELTYKVSGAYVKGDDLGVALSTDAKKDKAGTYAIRVSWNENPNYTATLTDGAYTVGKKPQPKINKAAAKIALDAGLKAYSSDDKVTASWGAVKGARSYEVYASYCDRKDYSKVRTVSGKITSIDITKLAGKKLNTKKNLKLYVVAYQTVKGKKVKVAKSILVHAPGSKNSKRTNVKAVKVKKGKYTLKKGKTAKIKAKLVLQKKNRKPLKHCAKFRYASSNKKVAKVSKKGRITAVGKGKCTVYVYAVSGVSKKIKVTVK